MAVAFRGRYAAQIAEFIEKEFLGTATVPVVVFGAAKAFDVLENDMLKADLDCVMAARTVVELLGD